MSSGIDWKYTFVSPKSEWARAPYIKYYVGLAWADYGPIEFIVSGTLGFASVKGAYSKLPGLGGNKLLWVTAPEWGPELVARIAASSLIAVESHKAGKEIPFPFLEGDKDPNRDLSDFCFGWGWWWAKDMLSFAGLKPEDKFLDTWEKLALAVWEWPKHLWGDFPETPNVALRRFLANDSDDPIVGKERKHVEDLCDRWALGEDPIALAKEVHCRCSVCTCARCSSK